MCMASLLIRSLLYRLSCGELLVDLWVPIWPHGLIKVTFIYIRSHQTFFEIVQIKPPGLLKRVTMRISKRIFNKIAKMFAKSIDNRMAGRIDRRIAFVVDIFFSRYACHDTVNAEINISSLFVGEWEYPINFCSSKITLNRRDHKYIFSKAQSQSTQQNNTASIGHSNKFDPSLLPCLTKSHLQLCHS